MAHPTPVPVPPRRPVAERHALRARSHSAPAVESGEPRVHTPWTVRIVQAELAVLAVLVATVPALLAVLLLFLAVLSIDGGSGVQTLALSAVSALGMVVAASAFCTGIVFVIHHLGRGSNRAWTGTLVVALAGIVLAVWGTEALLAPLLGLAVHRAVIALAAPEVLAVLLLVSPPTLRLVWGSPRQGLARAVSPSRAAS